jgi:hypothetical protein
MIERGNWLIEGIEEWSQFFETCNWYTFRVCHFEIEDDRVLGGIEATLVFLGVGFRWRWTYRFTEEMAGILQDVDDIKSGRVPLEDLPEIKLPR